MGRLGMVTALLFVMVCLPCAAQEGNPLPGSVEMAAGLLARHAYVDAGAESGKLGELHRDLREAEYLLGKKETDEAKRREMEAQREQASRALLAILQACPSAHAVRVGDGQVKAVPLGRVELPGDTAAFLFRVDRGEGPAYCVTRNLDFSVDAARTQFPVDVQAPGTAWVLVTLDRIPQGRTLIEFEFNGPNDAMTSVGLETVTMAHGMLAVRVLSDDTGRPAPAMIRLAWRTDGSEVRPANALDFGVLFDRQGQATGQRRMQIPGALGARYWCIPGPFEMALAPGEYEVTVLRGVEHRPVRETVTVRSNETTRRTWRPKRWVDMRRRGWYSGDDHVHTQMLSDQDAGMVLKWIQAEDVRLANVVKMGDIYRTWFEQRGFGPAYRAEENGYIVSPGQECPRTHDELGHTLAMNITAMVRDTERYYLYDTVFDEVHRQGGLAGYAHVNSDLFQVHRDMSINIPKEKIDFAEVLQFAKLGTDLYYDFLNLGFKITASSGSDVPWGGSVGEGRVYARVGRGRFTADRWFEAVRRGNTFVTNGLMLDFTVQGAYPGDEVERIVAEARAGRNANGEPDVDRPVTELAEQGPALLERVAAARLLYAELRAIAAREAPLRR